MSTLVRRILILALLVLYIILLLKFFGPHFQANCCGDVASTDDQTSLVDNSINNFPLASKWDTVGIFAGPGFDSLRNVINSGNEENKILNIIGYYYEGESAPEGYESMGLARAAKIRELYFSEIPEERIKLSARPFGANDSVKSGFFPAANFNWIQPEETVKEDVEVLDDRILIRFPYNSTEKVYNAAVEEYLRRLAPQVIESGERITLTGHTDNIGGDDFNQDLGLRRAEAIKALLVELGVPASQITTSSKGKTLPVDTNSTEGGRQNNRRVELVRIAADNS